MIKIKHQQHRPKNSWQKMTRAIKALCTLALFTAPLAATFAQSNSDSGEPTWYQVELVIFSQTLNANDTQETWPTDIVLAYPLGTVALKDPSLANDPLAAGDDTTRLSSELLSPEFTRLTEDQLSLSAVKESLTRLSRYRVLSHVAWRQPSYAPGDTKSVVISGGDLFDNHHELEGTIALKLSRYLHLQTNLWLTQFYPNYGQHSGYTKWPNLPEVPGGSSGKTAVNASNDDGLTELNYQAAWNKDAENSVPASFGLEGALPAISESNRPGYIVDKIIFNNQSRKMRTGEIHYIDHPAMGIIAIVTEWDRNQPENPAQELLPSIAN